MTQPEEHTPKEQPASADGGDFDDECDEDGEPVPAIQNDCRCAECCRHLLIEVGLDDARREPRIKERGDPIYAPAEVTASGQRELEGYLLNSKDNDGACTFLNQTTHLCSIYETRPWVCRAFDCDGEGKEHLIELGIRPRGGRER